MKNIFWPIFLAIVGVCSAGLIAYSWLAFQMSRGVTAAREGEFEKAASIFALAEKPFQTVPGLPQLLKDDYEKLIFDQVNVLFAQGDQEAIAEKFEEAVKNDPSIKDRGDFAFWTGSLLFHRAAAAKKGEEALDHLKSARAEYQRGLAAVPEDWDLKYNYEVISQIFSQKQQDTKREGERVKSILDKMRPAQEKKQDIAPEKQG